MRTVDLSHEARSLEELLSLAHKENIILRLSSGKEFLLAEIDDFDREIELIRQNEELMAFLAERAKESKTYTLNEVREALDLK